MDWQTTFNDKFQGDIEIPFLKARRFHGQLIINFADGDPKTAHVVRVVRPYAEVSSVK